MVPRQTLPPDQQEELVRRAIPVVRSGFGTEVTDEDIRNHILGSGIFYQVEIGDEFVGFGAFNTPTLAGEVVLYCFGVVFAEEHQRKGLLHRILHRAMAEHGYRFIATRTQNPVLYVTLADLCCEIHPRGREPVPEPYRGIARELAARLGMQDFDPQTLVEIGTYGGCMTAVPVQYMGSDKENVRAFAEIGLVPERGDSVILVGRLH